MKSAILPLFLSLLFPPMLDAGPSVSNENETDLTLRVFPIQRRPTRNLFYQNPEGEFVEIRFRTRLRSDPYPYNGPARIAFHRPAPEPDPETGLPIYIEISSVTVDQREGDVLIFFLESRTSADGEPEADWELFAVDDRLETFPLGHMRVFNATGVELEGSVGGNGMSLGFEISPPLALGSEGRGRSATVLFALDLGEAGHEMVFANRLEIPNRNRSILVLRPPRRRRSIQIDSFLLEDSPQADPEEEEETP